MTASPTVNSMLELVEVAQRAGLPHDTVYAGPVKWNQACSELLPFFGSMYDNVEELYVAGIHIVPSAQPGLAVGAGPAPTGFAPGGFILP